MYTRSYRISPPQHVQTQNRNAFKPPPTGVNMANLKGDRFQHVLERSKDLLERSKARQDAIEKRSKVLLERSVSRQDIKARFLERSKARQDTKGRSKALFERSKAREDVKHQQHVKKNMDEESRAATSSHVASSHKHASIQMEDSEESVGAYRVNGGQVMEADVQGSGFFDKSFVSNDEGHSSDHLVASTRSRLSFAFASSTRSRLSSARGLVAAEPIESEAIVYTEASHDTSKRNIRLIYLFGCMAIAAVSIGTLVTRYFLNQQDGGGGEFVDPQCRLSAEDQNVMAHCLCRRTTTELLPFLSQEELDTYDRGLVDVYKTQHLLAPDRTWHIESCVPENQAILWISNYRRLGAKGDDPRLFGIQYLTQVYVFVSLYLTMGGKHWLENRGWLSDINICDWFGIE
jgi:hypothetical protein